MRIIFVHRMEWPAKDPGVTAATLSAHALASIGVDMCMITAKGTNKSIKEELQQFYDLPLLKGLDIVLLRKIANSGKLFYFQAAWKIWRMSRKQKIHAIISRDPGFWPFLVWLKKRTGAKVVAELHNYFYTMTDDPHFLKDAKMRNKYIPIEQANLHKVDALFCSTPPLANLYKQHISPECVHVLKAGTQMSKRAQPSINQPIIGYLGSLQPQRDFETVFRALQLLKHPTAKLLIVGGLPKEKDRIRQLIDDFKISDRVEMTGWLPYGDIDPQLSRFTIGLVPMEDNMYNREVTAPLKILEYMARGIPILATDLPSAYAFFTPSEAGEVYPAGKPKALAQKIDAMLNDPVQLKKLGETAYAQAQTMTWENRAKKMMDVLSQI